MEQKRCGGREEGGHEDRGAPMSHAAVGGLVKVVGCGWMVVCSVVGWWGMVGW